MNYVESNYENALIELFNTKLDYFYKPGPEILRDQHSILLEEELATSLQRINPSLPQEAIAEAIYKVKNLESGSLIQKNKQFMDYLQNGVPVTYYHNHKQRSALVWLIDYKDVLNNEFLLVNQLTIIDHSEKRPDLILFVNGLPLVVMELKSPVRENTDSSEAFRQIRTYIQEIPTLFAYNAFCVLSDMAISKAGTITSNEERYMEWKSIDGSYEKSKVVPFTTFFKGMFEKGRFLDLLQNFLCFNNEGEISYKILGAYHQYFAVKKALESTKAAVQSDGKGGVIWHTQGSGKSLTMVFYAHYLQQVLDSPTIVVITDRNDLDFQLFKQFSNCKDFLRQTPVMAQSRQDLKNLLENRQANGIIFTTLQKFEESDEPLSKRSNIVVIADEAHRSHYGLAEKVQTHKREDGTLEAKTISGFGRMLRNSLPNATYIGFTGTPITSKDRSTVEVFGNYIDIYDMTQAIEDGATKPIYYESRAMKLKLDEKTLKEIDETYELLERQAERSAIEKSKKEMGKLDSILGADSTIESLARDIIDHYENNRAALLTGKAMIVAYSREIAMKIYHKILELRPDWKERVGVIMTLSNDDPEEWRELLGGQNYKDKMAKKFKDNESSLKIVIVVDMWLTGFDVPSLATMYVYKPMKGHNLMQAIARVNRVFEDKEGGLIVDYVGIASALKQAMNDYTKRDKSNYSDMDIAKTALVKFQEKLEVCRDFFYGFDYQNFFTGTDLEKGELITNGVDFLLGKSQEETDKGEAKRIHNLYLKEALLLKQALSLCSSIVEKEERLEAAYFEAIRIFILRLCAQGDQKKISLKEINDQINELLKQSVQSEGVVTLLSQQPQATVSLFDPDFLKEVSRLKQKNLAVEMLKKLLREQVHSYQKSNLVKSQKFSEILENSLKRYINGLITNEEVIDELIKLAQEISQAAREGKELGLTEEEQAFYDALTKPEAIKDLYSNQELVELTKELTEKLRKSRTIDWQKKQSARAGMRSTIKRLLKRHRYPPEGMEFAIDNVMKQCELWVDNPPA